MIANQLFFITGAASGIGAAAARRVLRDGHRAVLADIQGDAVESLAAELGDGAHAIRLDVRDEAAWQRAFHDVEARLGPIDVLVNNAGVLHVGFVMDLPAAKIREHFEVNVMGVVHGLHVAFARMSARGKGHIVNVASVASFAAVKGQVTYCASKHAVRAIHYGFAQEHRTSPVRLSIVHPGAVDTPMIRNVIGNPAASLAFADPAVTADAVADAIALVVRTGKREIMVPRFRNQVLRLIGVWPGLLWRMIPRADARGARNMAKLAARREPS
jgi:NADP-dependent 3-hydroxy acid dehydrogenase YdfG